MMRNMTMASLFCIEIPSFEFRVNIGKSFARRRHHSLLCVGFAIQLPILPCIKLALTIPQCMKIWLLMTELWRVFNIVNSELLLPVEIKMLPNNLFHKIFIRGMFTVHPIIPFVRSVLFAASANWLTDPYAAAAASSSSSCSAPSSFMRANKGWKIIILLLTPPSTVNIVVLVAKEREAKK